MTVGAGVVKDVGEVYIVGVAVIGVGVVFEKVEGGIAGDVEKV